MWEIKDGANKSESTLEATIENPADIIGDEVQSDVAVSMNYCSLAAYQK